ncbi:MAG: sulfur carrier protein ThiS [Corynebacterium sp.]|nr:sulfur carrier protein ThiS [Corynebacterium sp.]
MDIDLNGKTVSTAATTVAALVDELAQSPDGIAVAVNGHVIPRSQWHTPLQPNSRIEVLGAVQGG